MAPGDAPSSEHVASAVSMHFPIRPDGRSGQPADGTSRPTTMRFRWSVSGTLESSRQVMTTTRSGRPAPQIAASRAVTDFGSTSVRVTSYVACPTWIGSPTRILTWLGSLPT
jgi:hypothetical protein